MRKIELNTWKEKVPDGEGNIIERDATLLVAINALLINKDPNTMPKGLDKFRTFNRLGKAFDAAEKEGVLTLDDADYIFIKKIVESDIPAAWGMNPDINKALELFLGAEETK